MSKVLDGKPLICHGCLSTGRNLQPLTHNADLYFILLNNSTFLDGTLFIDILLCWECVALLERVKYFQKRIQRAQKDLEKYCFNSENLLSDTKSLSSLNIVNNYEIVSTFCKKEEEERNIKVELEIEKLEKDEKVSLEVNTKIKEETYEDLNSIIEDLNDADLYTNCDDVTESTYDDVTLELNNEEVKPNMKIKKRKSKKIKHKRSMLDTSNIDFYFSKIIFTLNSLQKLKKDNLKMFKKKIQMKVITQVKKISSMKSKDILKLAKTKATSCSFCNLEINLDTVNSHYEEHKIDTYECRLCGKTYNSPEETSKHIVNGHRFVYSCPECDQCFHIGKDLRKHLLIDHKCICGHCNKEFRTKKRITSHMRLMHLPATCRICKVTFRSGERLKKHLRRVHVPHAASNELCYCVECDKHYPHVNAYKAHLRSSVVHVPKRIYRVPCPECGQVFHKKTNMTNHYKLFHLKQTKHYCNICDKYYNNGYGLRCHTLYVHEKAEKPRNKICDICGRAFHNQKILTNHIRTHTGERPHKCPHCPAAFAQRTAMVSHIRTQHKYLK